jgi:hypothetical protein
MTGSMMKPVLSILSHTIVAGVGWALVMAARSPLPPPAAEPNDTTAEARQPAAKTRARESWQGDGGRLLRELMERKEKLEDFRDIPPAADRAAAAMAAMGAFRANPGDPALLREASARLAHWLEVDPKAAMACWEGPNALWFAGSPGGPLSTALTLAAANADLTTLLACLEPPEHYYPGCTETRNKVLLPLLVKALAGTGSASQLADALKALHPSYGLTLLYQAIPAWPENRLDEVGPLLAVNNDTNLLAAYLERLPGSQQRSWLQTRFSGDVPADPSQAALLRSLLNRANALPLQERTEWIARLDQASGRTTGRTTTQESLVTEDITYFLNRMNWEEDGRLGDWRYRLRHDQVTAAEVLAEVQRALPDAASHEPDLLLRSVYEHVAQYAPEGAMGLLAGLPMADREKLMLDSAFFSGGTGNPKALLDLVSTLPPNSGSDANERFKVWLRAANPSVGRLGDSYGAWALEMPHGVERDMALSALGAHFDADDPQAAAFYRAAKTVPEGWTPGQK